MKKKPDSKRAEKISISLPKAVVVWLRAAAEKRGTSVSQIIQDWLPLPK